MKAVTNIKGAALPLARANVDTDQIIPASWLKRVERLGFGEGLFSEWRKDPNFVLNDKRFLNATILVADANFGIGSSREHAVWALQDYGFTAVVAPSMSDIFRNNCTKCGLVPVVVSQDLVSKLLEAVNSDPTIELEIDVTNRTLSTMDKVEQFPLDDFTQYRFINGLDDIGLTLTHEDQIIAYEAGRTDRPWLPVTL